MILVPVGGGGLSTGVSTLAKMLNQRQSHRCRASRANCLQESLKQGHPVTLKGVNTIADGTAVKTPGETIFPYLQENLDDIITIEDDELIVAFLDILENHKMLVVENSGLLVAVLKHLKPEGKKVVSILKAVEIWISSLASVVQTVLSSVPESLPCRFYCRMYQDSLIKYLKLSVDVQGNIFSSLSTTISLSA